jgi:protein-tyrosine phosphatase
MNTSTRRALAHAAALRLASAPSSSDEEVEDESDAFFDGLGRDVRATMACAPLSEVYRSPSLGGGSLFIGDETAAASLPILEENRISVIINCTATIPHYHAHNPRFRYVVYDVLRFLHSHPTPDRVLADIGSCLSPLVSTVQKTLASGQSVLVHCLAGAHRAGTVGVAIMMSLADVAPEEAVRRARETRPIVDPVGRLTEVLFAWHDYRTAHRAPPP